MNWNQTVGRLLGYEDVTSIDSVRLTFGAPWASGSGGGAWIVLGCLALCGLSWLFYHRFQRSSRVRVRALLAVCRAVSLCLLLLILADPIVETRFTSHPRPALWVLFDGSDSMAIADQMPLEQQQRLSEAVDLSATKPGDATAKPSPPTRSDYVRALVRKTEDNLFDELHRRYRLRGYLFDAGADGVRSLRMTTEEAPDTLDHELLASQLTTDGQVTAIGDALENLALRHATSNLAGVLVISDFDQNSGQTVSQGAQKLGAAVKVFALGVGSPTAVDLAVEIRAPLRMKKAEQSTVTAIVSQKELDGRLVQVRVLAERTAAESVGQTSDQIVVGEREVELTATRIPVEFPFTPAEPGRYVFRAEVDPLEAEIVEQNNQDEREVTVIDDFMRLLFVEQEPTWEWRFVKEVFHRDKLVGMRGFRTFLRSADPSVRESNELFLPTLTMPRSEFFRNDVIFLGDIEGSKLSGRFCEMTKEFVSQFGGGLVVIAGPRFGPGQLAGTAIADMLPVIVDADARLRDARDFQLMLAPMAAQFDFMQLGEDPEENRVAWANLGKLPWYQPVKRLEPSASTVLASHPTDTCVDGKTPQPLIAVRKYGRGEVIYVAMNEMWRMRRKYGELYYRQFWGQMIHRLGLSHALGSQKRFVVRTDRQVYQADETVLVTVEAYNRDFEPLTAADLPDQMLSGQVVRPGRNASDESVTEAISVTELRPGVFEARIPVFEGGEYRIRVTDPVENQVVETHVQVRSLSAERLSAVRNTSIQQSVARATNGRSYELNTVSQFLQDFNPPRLTETTVEVFPLWNTWMCFGLVVLLLLGEWMIRKLVNLA